MANTTVWCLLVNHAQELDGEPFKVEVSSTDTVDDLKVGVKLRKKLDLDDIDADHLVVWKCEDQRVTAFKRPKELAKLLKGIDFQDEDKALIAAEKVTCDFEGQIFLVRKKGGKRPRSSSGAEEEGKRMKPEELHSKIWNRVDLTQTLTRTVEVTEAHYTDLQRSLNGLHKRTAIDLVKLNILHSLREAVPSLQDEVESDVSEARDNHKLFPSVFKYLDLAPLGLKAEVTSRFPLPLLIREDYEDMTKLIDKEPQDNSGSVIVSGQPGTESNQPSRYQGKTMYLYLRLFELMIGGRPFLFQSNLGTVYHVTKESVEIIGLWSSPDPITAFIDGDKRDWEPSELVIRPSVQLIVAAPPKVASQKWTKQTGHGSFISQFAIKLWSRKELLLTGLFLHPSNLSLKLLEESTSYFGFNPRACFEAALSVKKMDRTKSKVIDAIDKAANEGIDKLPLMMKIARYHSAMLASRDGLCVT
ncbi:hypothetical protein EI94DRAFT_1789026 [Lactarius quietus]|nr:hypothetical protein EI94DRAFT_1789026 [Lactarius quietus]